MPTRLNVTILTGGRDSHYAVPLAAALASTAARVEVIGSEEFLTDELLRLPNVDVRCYYTSNEAGTRPWTKVARLIATYWRLLAYAVRTESRIFHVLWMSRAELIDIAILHPLFRLLGKTILFTAHNVDAGERDGTASRVSRWSLRRLYRTVDHVFVHTGRMKEELQQQFGVGNERITVIPYGLNTMVPASSLDRQSARDRLGVGRDSKVMLFFGHITPYKGVEDLLEATALLKTRMDGMVQLIIAGGVKNRAAAPYYEELLARIQRLDLGSAVLMHATFIPDDEIGIYFEAADVCVLPYKAIYQSGVLFLAYRFGLPVVATDVGSLREAIIDGRTGFVCRAGDPVDLAEKLRELFESRLHAEAAAARQDIRQLAESGHSWPAIAGVTYEVYRQLAPAGRPSTSALDRGLVGQ